MKIVKILAAFLAVCTFLGMLGCTQDPAPVVQGSCISLDAKTHILIIKNETDQKNITLDISQAKVGLTPRLGDVVRVVFRKKGEKNVALKVMNLTKQDLMRK